MSAAQPGDRALRERHPVVWYGVVFGVLAGIVLAGAGAGKVTLGQEMLVAVGAFAAGICYALAGGFAAGRSFSVRDGLKAGLLAGVISALISVPVDLICAQVFMSTYLPHMQALRQQFEPPGYVMTPAMVFGYEVEGVSFGAIGAVVFGGALGWAGGYFGSSMRQRWALAEKPAPGAEMPAAPPAESSAPVIPSGPQWGLAHRPPPPANGES